jgi:hypothetical protein
VTDAVKIRAHRARSWMARGRILFANGDLDGAFIFYWIGFNSLYGKDRHQPNLSIAIEEGNLQVARRAREFRSFLHLVEKLGKERLELVLSRRKFQVIVRSLLDDVYLNEGAWRKWAEHGLVSPRDRQRAWVAVSSNRLDVDRIFERLYVLRNQIFHGSSTDRSRANRRSLQHGVPVLGAFVEAFCDIIEKRGSDEPELQNLPYPPSYRVTDE